MIDKIAHGLDSLRALPRLMCMMYAVLFYDVSMWAMSLPDISNAQAAFLSTFVLAAPGFFGLYVNSGKSNLNLKSKD